MSNSRVGVIAGPFFWSEDAGCLGNIVKWFFIILAIALALWVATVATIILIAAGIAVTLWLYGRKLWGKWRYRSIATDREVRWAESRPLHTVWVEWPSNTARRYLAWRQRNAERAEQEA